MPMVRLAELDHKERLLFISIVNGEQFLIKSITKLTMKGLLVPLSV